MGYHIAETESTYELTYDFEIPTLAEFHPRWIFGKNAAHPINVQTDAVFRNLVFQLGMVELVSYWKITCSPRVEVAAGALEPEQISWWKTLYFGGLGEFFYVNGIDSDPWISWTSPPQEPLCRCPRSRWETFPARWYPSAAERIPP